MVQYATRAELHEVRDELKSDIRGIGVMFERLDSRISLLAEGIMSVRDELKADIRATETRLVERLEVVESAVRQNSADIRQNSADIRQNSADIRQNSADIEALRRDVAEIRKRV